MRKPIIPTERVIPLAISQGDIDDLSRDVGFAPATPIEEGIPRFVKWYREFYRV